MRLLESVRLQLQPSGYGDCGRLGIRTRLNAENQEPIFIECGYRQPTAVGRELNVFGPPKPRDCGPHVLRCGIFDLHAPPSRDNAC